MLQFQTVKFRHGLYIIAFFLKIKLFLQLGLKLAIKYNQTFIHSDFTNIDEYLLDRESSLIKVELNFQIEKTNPFTNS